MYMLISNRLLARAPDTVFVSFALTYYYTARSQNISFLRRIYNILISQAKVAFLAFCSRLHKRRSAFFVSYDRGVEKWYLTRLITLRLRFDS